MTLSERMPADESDSRYVTIGLLALFAFAGLMVLVAGLSSGQGGAPMNETDAGAPTVTNGTAAPAAAEAPANETTGTERASAGEATATPEPTESPTPTAESTSGSSSGGNGGGAASTDTPDESTATPTATETATPAETATPTETATASPSETASPTPTATATPTATSSPTPTATPTATSTPTETPTPTATPTMTPDPTPTPSPDSYQGNVTNVVAGDTMDVRLDDNSTERVRLLGVDVPSADGENDPDDYEGVPDTEEARECLRAEGEKAQQYAHDRLLSRTVELTTDDAAKTRDDEDRLLVYLNVRGTDFNAYMLEEGHARVPDTTFSRSEEYADIEADTREDSIGVWGCSRYGTPTPDDDS